MFSALGAPALVMAGIGLYGILADSVVQRTHEVGIRVALGASGPDVTHMTIGEGMRITIIGIAVGVGVALMAGRLLAAPLFETEVADPKVLAAVAITQASTAILAGAIPALRATRPDPTWSDLVRPNPGASRRLAVPDRDSVTRIPPCKSAGLQKYVWRQNLPRSKIPISNVRYPSRNRLSPKAPTHVTKTSILTPEILHSRPVLVDDPRNPGPWPDVGPCRKRQCHSG